MAAARRRARGDDGVGLIEVLMTIALMSVAFVAILGALFVVIRTSRTHEVRADTNTVLVGAAEAVKAADFCDPADSCVPSTSYEAHLDAVDLPTGWTRAALHVTTIVPDTTSGRLVQDVTVEVVSPQGDITQTMTVAKTSPPPPPPTTIPTPTDQCTTATVTARAFWFIGFVLVEVDTPPDVDACVTPIRAHVVGGSTTELTQNPNQPTRWSGWTFAWECLLPFCQIDVLQGDGTLIMTIPVESFF